MYGRIIQTIGVLVVIVAVEVELWLHAPVYLILATLGSLTFALGTKIVYFSKKRPWNGRERRH